MGLLAFLGIGNSGGRADSGDSSPPMATAPPSERAEALREGFAGVRPQCDRIAVISDIHGNLQALFAVTHRLAGDGVDRVVCLGDLVGYGANPREVVDLVQTMKYATILGNHDRAACNIPEPFVFNEQAAVAVEWTKAELRPEHLQYVQSLELVDGAPELLCVHGSPNDPSAMGYIFEQDATVFESFEQRLCAVGHSHVPLNYLQKDDGEIICHKETEFTVNSNVTQAIVNVGSVGQPRDGDPRACYAVFDLKNWPNVEVTLRRVEYNVDAAAAEIRRRGLPEYLAVRLQVGM